MILDPSISLGSIAEILSIAVGGLSFLLIVSGRFQVVMYRIDKLEKNVTKLFNKLNGDKFEE